MTMHIKTEKLGESPQPGVPKALVVMKICLLMSIVVGALLIVLALAGKRGVLGVAGTFIPLVALQYFFYVMAKAKWNSVEK
jgi:hypothetical protein